MPKKLANGKDHHPTQPVSPEYQLASKLMEAFQETWKAMYAEGLADPMTFSRMSVVALTQLAAIVGVDVGMSTDQFIAINKANFEEAFRKAPKFS
jgi:hypothetical protein